MKKKFYVAMPIVLICAIMTLIAILGFVWEVVDVGAFVPFAFKPFPPSTPVYPTLFFGLNGTGS